MEQHEIEAHIKNIANRTERIEQILPKLATKKDLQEEGERTRRHFDVVAEEIKVSLEKYRGRCVFAYWTVKLVVALPVTASFVAAAFTCHVPLGSFALSR